MPPRSIGDLRTQRMVQAMYEATIGRQHPAVGSRVDPVLVTAAYSVRP